jgi:hypothetical protein
MGEAVFHREKLFFTGGSCFHREELFFTGKGVFQWFEFESVSYLPKPT